MIKSDIDMNPEKLQRDGEIGQLKGQEGSSLDFTHSPSLLVSSHPMVLFSDLFSFLRRASREFQVPGLLELAPPSREKQRSADIVIHNIRFLSFIPKCVIWEGSELKRTVVRYLRYLFNILL